MQQKAKPFLRAAGCLALIILAGCAAHEQVRVDLNTFLSNQTAYEGKRVTITASIDDVLRRAELYRGRQVEVAAPVAYYGRKQYWTWYLLLEEHGRQLRCYTHHYRLWADRFAIMMLDQAMHAKEAVTVVGHLHRDGLDIEQLTYDNSTIRTDLKHFDVAPLGWWGGWGWYY